MMLDLKQLSIGKIEPVAVVWTNAFNKVGVLRGMIVSAQQGTRTVLLDSSQKLPRKLNTHGHRTLALEFNHYGVHALFSPEKPDEAVDIQGSIVKYGSRDNNFEDVAKKITGPGEFRKSHRLEDKQLYMYTDRAIKLSLAGNKGGECYVQTHLPLHMTLLVDTSRERKFYLAHSLSGLDFVS